MYGSFFELQTLQVLNLQLQSRTTPQSSLHLHHRIHPNSEEQIILAYQIHHLRTTIHRYQKSERTNLFHTPLVRNR